MGASHRPHGGPYPPAHARGGGGGVIFSSYAQSFEADPNGYGAVSWSFGGSHGFWNKEKVNGEAAPKAEAVEEAEKVVKGEAVAAEKVVHEVNPNEEEPSGQRWWARFGGAGGD